MSIYRKMARLALRNVRRNWRHSLAAVFAISSGFTAVSLMDAFLGEILQKLNGDVTVKYMLGDVVFQRVESDEARELNQWTYSITAAEQKFIDDFLAADPTVKLRIHRLNFSGLLSSGTNTPYFLAQSFDVPDDAKMRGDKWAFNTLAGLPLHLTKDGMPILIGEGLANFIGCHAEKNAAQYLLPDGNYRPEKRPFSCEGKEVNLSVTTDNSQYNALDMNVAGLVDGGLREIDQHLVQMPLALAQQLLDTDKVSLVSVLLNSPEDTPAFLARAREALSHTEFHDLEVIPWRKHLVGRFFEGGEDILKAFRNIFMSVVVIIGVISVANTMAKAVSERTTEIGALRSIGYFRRHLIGMFAFESMFLAMAACGIGLVVTIVITVAINYAEISYKAGIMSSPVILKLRFTTVDWLATSLMLSGLACGTGIYASYRANHKVIADLQRQAE